MMVTFSLQSCSDFPHLPCMKGKVILKALSTHIFLTYVEPKDLHVGDYILHCMETGVMGRKEIWWFQELMAFVL